MEKKRFYLTTTTEGCATNLVENSSYTQYLNGHDYERTRDPEQADYILINTCAYTTDQENKSVDKIEELSLKYPNAKVLVGGCLPKIAPDKVSSLGIEGKFGPGDIKKLGEILNIDSEESSCLSNSFDPEDYGELTFKHRFLLFLRPLYFKFEKLFRKNFQPLHNIIDTVIINEEFTPIVVSQGCDGKCTFCSIKAAKGNVKSRPLEVILFEIKKALQQGKKKIWIIGDDIGCYGIDRGSSFPDLIRNILAIKEDFQIVINYTEPYFFLKYFSEIKELFKDERILNVNLPIQSGSNHIIKKMGRNYDITQVYKKLNILKASSPHLVVKTNIIVGFPGERLKDFIASIKSVFFFDAILALSFTPRKKTLAFNMENQLSRNTIKLRTYIINIFILIRHIQVSLKSIF